MSVATVADAVVCVAPPFQLTDPPAAICAKLGCPPDASPDIPSQPMSFGLTG